MMSEKRNLLSIVILFAVIFGSTEGLKCWRCSSDVTNGAFCEDPFDVNLMTEHQRKWSYVDCILPVHQIPELLIGKVRPVCKKLIQNVHDKVVFARSCSWEEIESPPDACKHNTMTPPFVRTMFCETCTYDGCNADNSKLLSTFDPAKNRPSNDPQCNSGETLRSKHFMCLLVIVLYLLSKINN